MTLALNPYQSVIGPLVRTLELRFGRAAGLPGHERLAAPDAPDRLWLVGGSLRGECRPEHVRLTLLERGLNVPVAPDGRFLVGNLEEGTYTFELASEGAKPRQQKIIVPSPSYDIEV